MMTPVFFNVIGFLCLQVCNTCYMIDIQTRARAQGVNTMPFSPPKTPTTLAEKAAEAKALTEIKAAGFTPNAFRFVAHGHVHACSFELEPGTMGGAAFFSTVKI
jgi:hypothetical protein